MLQLSKLTQMVMHLTCFQQIPGYDSSEEFCIFPDPTEQLPRYHIKTDHDHLFIIHYIVWVTVIK